MPPLPKDFLGCFPVLKKITSLYHLTKYCSLSWVLLGILRGSIKIMLYNPIENDKAFQLKNLYRML
jgi:hypothetical protein